MSTCAGRPPELLPETVSTLVSKFYKFGAVQAASVKSFPSFEDRNYYFIAQSSNGNKGEYVLKVSNPIGIKIDQLYGINQLMSHLKSYGLCLGCPLTDRKGDSVVQLSKSQLVQMNQPISGSNELGRTSEAVSSECEPGELVYFLRVLVFVPGTLLHHIERHHFVPSLLYSIGEKLAKMDKVLMNFSNTSLEARQLGDWDLSNFVQAAKSKKAGSSHEDEVTKIIQGFEDTVEPLLPKMKKSIIHFDATELNIIVNHSLSKGCEFLSFIDFGDVIKTYTVIDLAVSVSSLMTYQADSCANVVKFVVPLIHGYHDILPLCEDELNCLYYLVLARCCLLALNCEIFYKAEPWNDYIKVKIDKNWKLVHLLLSISKDEVVRTWKVVY